MVRAAFCSTPATPICACQPSFLVFDHGHGFDVEKPLLFETMVFGGAFDREMERYCTYDEAEYGHKAWVAKVFPALVKA